MKRVLSQRIDRILVQRIGRSQYVNNVKGVIGVKIPVRHQHGV